MIKTFLLFLLMLLKILGVILLTVLIFAVVLMLLVLFVPVRYQAFLQNEKSMEPQNTHPVKNLKIQVKVTWLLHLLHISVNYSTEGISNKIRIVGIDIQKVSAWFTQRKKRKRNRNKTKKNDLPINDPQTEDFEKTESETKESENEDLKIPAVREEEFTKNSINKDNDTEDIPKKENPAENDLKEGNYAENISGERNYAHNSRKGSRKKTSESRKKARRKKQVLPEKTGSGKKKESSESKSGGIKNIKNKIRQFHKEFTDEINRNAVTQLWKEICFLLRNYRPRKMKADLTFSLADPAVTGEVLGLISLLPFIYRYPCRIIPDFTSDKLYLEGEIMIQGKVTAGFFLLSLLRLIRSKEFMQVVHRLMKRN